MGGSFSATSPSRATPSPTTIRRASVSTTSAPTTRRRCKIPLVGGRDLSANDTVDGRAVALINESMARIYWKDRDPVGGRLMFGRPRPDQEPQWITVVGVIKDIKQRSLTERPVSRA